MPTIRVSDTGEVHLSGSARVADIASDALVKSRYPLLADACALEAASGIDASLADSLASVPACEIIAGNVHCALNGTTTCSAKRATAPLHSIIGGGPCWRAYTSLTGIALHTLDGVIEFGEGNEARTIVRVRLPADSADGYQHFFRTRLDAAPGSAISVAAVRRTDGDVRIVLGGVAPIPYRVYTSVEEEAMAGGLDEDTIAGLAERALLDAEVDADSAARFEAAAALLRTAITEIAANSP